jgi:putative peptidoglycan lipid II flippase
VNRIFKLFNSEIAGVHQAAFLIGFFTFLSQLIALGRDRMLAHYFGASQTLDIYYAAFRIPDFIYAAIASLVSISVLIPFFSGVFENDTPKTQKLMSDIFTVFLVAMIVISAIIWICMPYIAPILMPNMKDPHVLNQLISVARLLLLQPICLGISNLLGVITQISKRFFLYGLSPIVYNLSIVGGLVFLYPFFGIDGVIIGVVVGSILHFAIQIPYVGKLGLIPHFTFKVDWKTVKEVCLLSIPRTLTLSASTMDLIFITSYASFITAGSIAIYSLSNNLQSVPFAIVGVSYTLAAFPTLSASFARGERAEFINHVTTAARHIVFWSIPTSVFFIVLRAQIVRVILGSGQFNWDDTRLSAACLALFTLSLASQGLELLFIRAYYAAGKTTKPLLVNLLSSIVTIGMPYVLLILFNNIESFRTFVSVMFKVYGIAGNAVLMLPLGFSIGTILNALIFWVMFERDFGSLDKVVGRTVFTSLSAGIIGGFVSYIVLNFVGNYVDLNTFLGVFSQGLVSGVAGVAVAIGIFKLLGSDELEVVWKGLNQKLVRNKVVVAESQSMDVM